MANCGIATFTCVFLLLSLTALYTSASLRSGETLASEKITDGEDGDGGITGLKEPSLKPTDTSASEKVKYEDENNPGTVLLEKPNLKPNEIFASEKSTDEEDKSPGIMLLEKPNLKPNETFSSEKATDEEENKPGSTLLDNPRDPNDGDRERHQAHSEGQTHTNEDLDFMDRQTGSNPGRTRVDLKEPYRFRNHTHIRKHVMGLATKLLNNIQGRPQENEKDSYIIRPQGHISKRISELENVGSPRNSKRRGKHQRQFTGVNRRMMRLAAKLHRAMCPFAAKLLRSLVSDLSSNVVVSPLSVYTALTLPMLGAQGPTWKEFFKVLGLRKIGVKRNTFHLAYRGLMFSLGIVHPNVKLHLGNTVYVNPNNSLEVTFRQDLSRIYNASCDNFNMNHPQGPERAINDWISTATGETFQNLMSPGTISPLTSMILVNAVYFNATWDAPFKPHWTLLENFTTLSQGVKSVHMMLSVSDYNYVRHDDSEVIEIPYSGDRLAMYILLPSKTSNIRRLLKRVTNVKRYGPDPLECLLEGLGFSYLELLLPKFQIDSGLLNLKDPLQNLGFVSSFLEEKADFSGISASKGLYVSYVFHKALINVNEGGTGAVVAETDIRSPPNTRYSLKCKVDRPFLFAIRDKAMKVVLFMGAYVGH